MRPIILKGHSRSLTMIKYNRDGDLLFSCAKDHTPNLWYSDTGERVGTYVGHAGAVWACDVSYHSEKLLTAAADASVKLWDVQTGDELFSFPHTGPARSVNFSTGDKQFVSVADKFSDRPAAVFVYELADDITNQSAKPVLTITNHGHDGRITGAYWMPLNKAILTTEWRRRHEAVAFPAFEARFFHMIFQRSLTCFFKGHFGPINTIGFISENGKSYASGAEDGYVRLHHFDNDYLKLDANK
ncbi:unnamed protein product [Peronospora destructor]|uniref:Serine-threonine kinase receptor-associated protein n=1 Tax=Peronospora destructor TaxID=86335 RepID=A0AAV0TS17_9STRA|nr:unnamed protein product [Peronospora destructor]